MLHSFISILLSYVFLSALGHHKCMNYNAHVLCLLSMSKISIYWWPRKENNIFHKMQPVISYFEWLSVEDPKRKNMQMHKSSLL